MKLGRVIIGAGLLGIACLPLAYVQARLREHNWSPLARPVELTTGRLTSAEFIADLTGTYIVSLAFKPTNVAREECLVGNRSFKESCATPGDGLKVDWSVTRQGGPPTDDDPVANQPYTPHSFGGDGVETELGRFEARAGQRYKVGLRAHQSSPDLSSASPTLKVNAHWHYWEGWAEYKQFALWFAAICGVGGVFNLVKGFDLS